MSSSDSEDNHVITQKKGKKSDTTNYQIKPSKGEPSMDTSKWPLLLKVMPNIININFYTEL